jgi:hypothetical protein
MVGTYPHHEKGTQNLAGKGRLQEREYRKGLRDDSPEVVSSARPFLITYPTGRCIHELATRIQYAERLDAIATTQMQTAWSLRLSSLQPECQIAMNGDSRKKATANSIARIEPQTSPTYCETPAQFVPNRSSSVNPVTTPTAKLVRKIFPQNLVIILYSLSTLRRNPLSCSWNGYLLKGGYLLCDTVDERGQSRIRGFSRNRSRDFGKISDSCRSPVQKMLIPSTSEDTASFEASWQCFERTCI